MEYLGTKFTHSKRLLLLILFIIAFFVISPIIIMYTAGYRYDWQSGLLKETGAISIDIEPENAAIYLNGIKLKDEMPVRLKNIAPAKYNLRATAPGYFDWLKEIEVKNKQTNYTKEISLLKKNKPQILINEKIEDFAISYDGRFIIYSMNKNKSSEIWLWNNDKQSATILFNLNIPKPAMVWAKKNNYIAIGNSVPPYSHLFVVNAENPLKQFDLAKNNRGIKKFEWESSSEPQLYFGTKDNIFLYSPVAEKSQIIAKNIYLDWRMENGQLWTMQAETSTKQYKIIKDTLGFNSIFNRVDSVDVNLATGQTEEENLRIAAAQQNTVLLQNDKIARMILVTNSNKYKISAEKFLVSKYNNWWLMWSQWELWTYSEGEEPNLLNRSGEHLRQVTPVDKYNTLALTWENKITALFPYYSVSHDLIGEKIINLAADTDNKILYFISREKNKEGIWKLTY